MDKAGFVVVSPHGGFVILNSEGVDSVEGLEVVEVRN